MSRNNQQPTSTNQIVELMSMGSSAAPAGLVVAVDDKEEKQLAEKLGMSALPPDMLNSHLAPLLTDPDLAALDRVFHLFPRHGHGNTDFFSTGVLKIRKQAIVNELLRHVVTGNQAAVEGMIKKYPTLLLERGQTTDFSGRRFENVTALMLAAGAGDVDMVAVIAAALDEYYPDEKLAQYHRQFPPGDDKEEQQRETENIAAVEEIYADIKNASEAACELVLNHENAIPPDNKEAQALLSALHKFRHKLAPYGYYVLKLAGDEKELQPHRLYVKLKAGGFTYTVLDSNNHPVSGEIAAEDFADLSQEERALIKDLTPASDLSVLQPYLSHILKITSARGHTKPCQVIETGHHFSIAVLIRAFELYCATYTSLIHKTNKDKLLWRKMIGYIQLQFTACMMQAFANGISQIVREKRKLIRSFKCFRDTFPFPVDYAAASNIGEHYAINLYGVAATGALSCKGIKEILEDYDQQKQKRFQELFAPLVIIQNHV